MSSKIREGAYIQRARDVLALTRGLNTTQTQLTNAKQSCASQMHSVNMRSFEFRETNDTRSKTYNARLERPQGERVSVKKLYTLLANGEMDLEDFLSLVSANRKKVTELLGDKATSALLETYQKGLDLVIEEVT